MTIQLSRGAAGAVTVPAALLRATSDPGSYVPRRRYEDDTYESVPHWVARAVARWAESATSDVQDDLRRAVGGKVLSEAPGLPVTAEVVWQFYSRRRRNWKLAADEAEATRLAREEGDHRTRFRVAVNSQWVYP